MDAIATFAALVDRPVGEVDLARAALAFAACAAPGLDPGPSLLELDHLARGVRDFDDLRARLFSEAGFAGAIDGYYAPESSLLDRVLATRRGIPISLSVVVMEVGRRAGVVVQGIGAPGHFLVRDAATGRLCDAFDGGAWVDEARVAAALPPGVPVLPVADAHMVLTRMLTNLVHVYRRAADPVGLEWALRCQAELPGMRGTATAQLGEALAARGRFAEGADALVTAAAHVDDEAAADLGRRARGLRARLN